MSKIEYLIWQYDTLLHLVTYLLVRNRSYFDVTDYFAGDNETCQ